MILVVVYGGVGVGEKGFAGGGLGGVVALVRGVTLK